MILIVFRKAIKKPKHYINVRATFKNITYILQNCAVPQRLLSNMHSTDVHQNLSTYLRGTVLANGNAKTNEAHILPSKGLQSRKRFKP